MFSILQQHMARPPLFSVYTADTLWTDDHISRQMLEYHLDPMADIASRNHAFIERAAAWLVREFDLVGRTVLDLGCGPGLYALELAKLGAEVTGLDFSTRSIAYARDQVRKRGLQVEFQVGNYLSYDTERTFDLICLIYGDYCALDPGQRSALMRRAQRWLRPGGSIVFDVFTRIHLEAIEETTSFASCPDGGFWSAEPHFLFNTRFRYEDAGAYLDRYLIVQKGMQREVFNWLQCFDPVQLEEELATTGLRVAGCIGSVAGDPFDEAATEFAVVAQPASPRLDPHVT